MPVEAELVLIKVATVPDVHADFDNLIIFVISF